MALLKAQLIRKLDQIKGLETKPSKVAGGHALFYRGKEIAHFHGNNEIDVRLTKQVIKAEGLTHPEGSEFHPGRKPGSQWIELRFRRQSHLEEVIRLIKLGLKQY